MSTIKVHWFPTIDAPEKDVDFEDLPDGYYVRNSLQPSDVTAPKWFYNGPWANLNEAITDMGYAWETETHDAEVVYVTPRHTLKRHVSQDDVIFQCAGCGGALFIESHLSPTVPPELHHFIGEHFDDNDLRLCPGLDLGDFGYPMIVP